MAAHDSPDKVTMWFGNDEDSTRTVVKKVLNDINRILMNVEYVFPGDRCSPNSFAYVFKGESSLSKRGGKYLVYLCNLYMTTHIGEQIETLTHEGSHHLPAGTTDVCQPGSEGKDGVGCIKAYGQTACRSLAKADSASA